jgi:hypothetical protein
MMLLQQRQLSEVCSLLELKGRTEVVQLLRQAVSDCLSASSVETK